MKQANHEATDFVHTLQHTLPRFVESDRGEGKEAR